MGQAHPFFTLSEKRPFLRTKTDDFLCKIITRFPWVPLVLLAEPRPGAQRQRGLHYGAPFKTEIISQSIFEYRATLPLVDSGSVS